MKVKFLGVGSAFTTPDYYQSNILITASNGCKLLLDCGTDIRFSLHEIGISDQNLSKEISAIYISHLHSDHIGGMEWMAFQTYFSHGDVKPILFMEETIMHEMWNCSLRGGLGCIEGKQMHLTDYFRCQPVPDGGTFTWEGIEFTLVKMPHIITGYKDFFSYGLLIRETAQKGDGLFITTDTQFQPDLITQIAQTVDLIFHDCETSLNKTIVHAHYDDLCTLDRHVKQKMWLYHYQPNPKRNPEKDGFRGFVEKGMEFEFPGNPIIRG